MNEKGHNTEQLRQQIVVTLCKDNGTYTSAIVLYDYERVGAYMTFKDMVAEGERLMPIEWKVSDDSLMVCRLNQNVWFEFRVINQ